MPESQGRRPREAPCDSGPSRVHPGQGRPMEGRQEGAPLWAGGNMWKQALNELNVDGWYWMSLLACKMACPKKGSGSCYCMIMDHAMSCKLLIFASASPNICIFKTQCSIEDSWMLLATMAKPIAWKSKGCRRPASCPSTQCCVSLWESKILFLSICSHPSSRTQPT